MGVSVQGGLCPGGHCWGIFVQGDLCPGGRSLSKVVFVCEVSVWGLPDRDPPYGEDRMVRILLECILVFLFVHSTPPFSVTDINTSVYLQS